MVLYSLKAEIHANVIMFVIHVDVPAGILFFFFLRGGSGFLNIESGAIKTIMLIFCSTPQKWR